jgi:hypothetical protein
MDRLAVGLAAPCDPPGREDKLWQFMTEKFDGAPSLPFVAWVTHDFEYVHGFTGGRTLRQFEKDLEIVEASPLVPATLEVEKKITALAAKAAKAAETESWPTVLAAGREVAQLKGRCPQRDVLAEAVEQARDFAASRFDWVEDSVADAKDLKPLKAVLKGVQKQFKGEPEAETAKLGLKAVDTYARIAKLDGEKAVVARGKAAATFKDTRWAPLFQE